MKKILKLYGLTRTGTNLLQWLLTLNFKEYVCNIGSHNVDYLGWKHGLPPSKEIIDDIQKYGNEQPLFIFTNRNFDTWKEANTNRHNGSWELNHPLSNMEFLYFYTPLGYEKYDNYLDLYNKRQGAYKQFCIDNEKTTIMVDYEDLQRNQEGVILKIKEKFNLNLCYDNPISIKKHIDSNGSIYNYRN